MDSEATPKTSNESQGDGWQTIADSVGSFSNHIERNHQERLQRLMELSGVKSARSEKDQFDESIKELDASSAYRFLTHINAVLRGIGKDESGRRNNVRVGEHVAPDKGVQGQVLTEAVNAIKSIEDDKYRAALSYYVINGLHLFPDGNGRVSRAVYEIFENPDFDFNNDDSLAFHSQDASYGHGGFERKKNIRPASQALGQALSFVKYDLVKAGKINPVVMDRTVTLGIIAGDVPDLYLTEDANDNLSRSEKYFLNNAFSEIDIATIALNAMLTKKGTFDDIAAASTRKFSGEESICFEIMSYDLDTSGPNELSKKTFEGWTADDYRQFGKIFRSVQVLQYRKLIDFFANPDQNKFSNGVRVADWLSGKNN